MGLKVYIKSASEPIGARSNLSMTLPKTFCHTSSLVVGVPQKKGWLVYGH
jgi:hypothetical protein